MILNILLNFRSSDIQVPIKIPFNIISHQILKLNTNINEIKRQHLMDIPFGQNNVAYHCGIYGVFLVSTNT